MRHTWIATIALFTILVPTTSQALETKPSIAPVPDSYYYNAPGSNTLSAQVTMDREGEAEVALQLELKNDAATPLTESTIEIPGTAVRIIRALQEVPAVLPSPCKGSDFCAQAAYQTSSYQQMTPTLSEVESGTTVKLPFAASVDPSAGTRLYVLYKATGYATKHGARFDVDFPTPKLGVDLQSVTVSIDTADNLLLKGGRAATDTKENVNLAEGIASAPLTATTSSSISPDRFSSLYYAGPGIVKNTNSLDPNESFHVKASYAERWFTLYWPSVAWGVALTFALGVVLWLGERSIKPSGQKEQA